RGAWLSYDAVASAFGRRYAYHKRTDAVDRSGGAILGSRRKMGDEHHFLRYAHGRARSIYYWRRAGIFGAHRRISFFLELFILVSGIMPHCCWDEVCQSDRADI